MARSSTPSPLISPADMQVVERVLKMRTGYVLDFSDRTFDQFIAHEVGVDATAPRYSEDGGSKAKRLRRILPSLGAQQQAKLLRAFAKYRDSPARSETLEPLDDEWRQAFDKIIRALEKRATDADMTYAASSWTGRRTIREQVAIVRGLAPIALNEIENLTRLIESKRYNDPITGDAINCLRELHRQLGDLISSVDQGQLTRAAIEAIEANRQKLTGYVREGAKDAVVAPAMTFGVMHILAWLTGVPTDSGLVGAIYGALLGADALKSIGKRSTLS